LGNEEELEERVLKMSLGLEERLLAVWRRKMVGVEGKIRVGQENVGVGVVGVEGGFENADFLDYGSTGEVEMGGAWGLDVGYWMEFWEWVFNVVLRHGEQKWREAIERKRNGGDGRRQKAGLLQRAEPKSNI
jgi:hypothetical protein